MESRAIRHAAAARRHIWKAEKKSGWKLPFCLALVALCSAAGLFLQMLGDSSLSLFSIGNPLIAALAAQPEESVQVFSPADPMRVSFLPIQSTQAQAAVSESAALPRVLIYHTHATEAYLQTDTYTYEPSGKWRTEEQEKSVVAVGEALTKELQNVYGINVIHDTTNHEPPKLSTAYSRSLITMQEYKTAYPSISIFIDVHRDAYGTAKTLDAPQDFVTVDGVETARIMFVVGTGKGATGTGFSEMPDFESNYALAQAITAYIGGQDEKLVREVRVKTGRYNQHVSAQCLLVEVGHNANSLNQALAAIPRLAEGIAACIDQIPAVTIENADGVLWTPSA